MLDLGVQNRSSVIGNPIVLFSYVLIGAKTIGNDEKLARGAIGDDLSGNG